MIGRPNVTILLIGNKNIDAVFRADTQGSLRSLNELMKIIDEKCKKPALSARRFFVDPEMLTRKLEELWNSKRSSNLNIIAGGKQFKVHKSVLGMRCTEFAKILEDNNEATEIKILGFSSNAVEALLLFIYKCEVKADENPMEKIVIAKKFKFPSMRDAYKKIISDQLNALNARDIFMFAHHHSAEGKSLEDLKEKAFNEIARKIPHDLPMKLPKTLVRNLFLVFFKTKVKRTRCRLD